MIYHYLSATYLIIINLISFILMGTDKHRAIKKKWRIPEKTLFATALLFGSIGSVLGMYVFHHKTRHWYFVLFMPMILLLQVALLVFLHVKFMH